SQFITIRSATYLLLVRLGRIDLWNRVFSRGVFIRLDWNREDGTPFVSRLNHLLTVDAGRVGSGPGLMDEELKKKNRRFLIAIVAFAILLCLLVIIWKLSIYKIFP